MIAARLTQPLGDVLARSPGADIAVMWLGQAGFVIDGGGQRVVVDPYLSDSLAQKYRDTAFPHVRMMATPVAPGAIAHVDLVLTTHAHTDHMDPGTLPALMDANPNARLVAPKAVRAVAMERAKISEDRLFLVDAGETIHPLQGLALTATRAAHETLERDADGQHLFLGYAIQMAGRCIFHSGDTIPFAGQVAEVSALKADLALFPVNGRDAVRAANRIPGNMTVPEAVALAQAAQIPAMIAHHHGLFAFNTADPTELCAIAAASKMPVVHIAELGVCWIWP